MDLRNHLQLAVGKRRWLKKSLPAGLLDLVYVPLTQGRRIYADARDLRGPSFHVMYGGATGFEHYEKPEKDVILEHLPEDGVFLDIGANIGLFAFYVHWGRPRATIHAFEPHPRNIQCIERSCRANQISNVFPHPQAIGDVRGELELFFDESDAGGHSAYRETLQGNRAPTQSVRVPVIPIDEFVSTQGLNRVDIIKIDTQGGEAAAIRGARETLRRFKPALLIEIDYRHQLEGSAAGSVLHALQETGVSYQARAVEASPKLHSFAQLEDFARAELARKIYQRNYLFQVDGK